jgi:ectoine hydroxylase-related dioxygenase (phytanoyl-CoA dioxygenase family)
MVEPRYRLAEEQFRFFWENGYLGPLTCTHPNLGKLPQIAYHARVKSLGSNEPIPDPATWQATPAKLINAYDPHQYVPEILDVSTHTSIVSPVAQLLGRPEVAFFQSRFRVKFPHKADPVPWHQDVGESNGGYRADGSPVPSITAWLSVDGASAESGALSVIPKTHTRLWGNWRSGFHSKVEDQAEIRDMELSQSVPIEARPGEFYLFHSWTLHRSTTNETATPRSGLALRFVAPHDAVQPQTEYTLVKVGFAVEQAGSLLYGAATAAP